MKVVFPEPGSPTTKWSWPLEKRPGTSKSQSVGLDPKMISCMERTPSHPWIPSSSGAKYSSYKIRKTENKKGDQRSTGHTINLDSQEREKDTESEMIKIGSPLGGRLLKLRRCETWNDSNQKVMESGHGASPVDFVLHGLYRCLFVAMAHGSTCFEQYGSSRGLRK